MKLTFILKPVLRIFFFFICFGNLDAQINKNALVTPKLDSILNLVDIKIEKEDFKQVTIAIDSLKKTATYKKNRFNRLAIDLRYAQLLYERKEDKKAIYFFLEGINKLKYYPNSKLIWSYQKSIATIFIKHGNYKRAHFHTLRNIENAKRRNDSIDLLKSTFEKGRIFDRQIKLIYDSEEGDYRNSNKFKIFSDSALFYLNQVIAVPVNESTQKLVSSAYLKIGNISFHNNNLLFAEENYQKSSDILGKYIDNRGEEIFRVMVNLGNIYYRKEEYHEALKIYKKAYVLISSSTKRKFIENKADILQNISWSYEELGKYKLAYKYQEMAKAIYEDIAYLRSEQRIAVIESEYLESQNTENEKNKRLKTQLYFFGFVLLTIIIGILGYMIYNRLLNKQRKTELKISGLKYKALNAQMSPHFINNLLLCINDLLDTNEKDVAIENLDKFNRLTNLVLRSTKTNLITLSKEIQILELYMDLQLLRFNNKFDYVINTNEISKKDINSIQIPPLILQPLVENSIVHGFRNMDVKGKLSIDFKLKSDDFIKCTITDNGLETPENLMPEMYTKNGISLKNISERLELISQEKTNKELVVFSKVKNENDEVVGHKITLKIPLIYV